MMIWFVEGTNIEGKKTIVALASTEDKANEAEAEAYRQKPNGHFWVDGPMEVDVPPDVRYC